jgi:uncharacterized membrane protein
MHRREWILKRNCSLSPGQLARVFAVLCLVSLAVGIFWTLQGAWVVLCFTALEMGAVGWAFLYFGRHAGDRENIVLAGASLLVEHVDGERVSQVELDARRLQVGFPAGAPARSSDGTPAGLSDGYPARGQRLVMLTAGDKRCEVGRYLTAWQRQRLALELRQAVAGQRLH